ncbi:MAG: hypothetical protein F2923_06165 [Actinobacteria bacterium]|uniref:Unannotated protein n=1 Tax=freshwater metagenome TaxID=449393 RepID=A0A6J7SIZ0_9ZZZZ|nr:hypothetical protein [Actinomycetota bacterium]
MKLFGRRKLRWTILTSAPGGKAGEQWGDTWFARDLVDALRRQGQDASTTSRQNAHALERENDDVVVVLRGLTEVKPNRSKKNSIWILWVISHPELVTRQEAERYDVVFVASNYWKPDFVDVRPLLQATNPARFSPKAGVSDSGDAVLFVGSTRGVFRPIVQDAIAAHLELSLYGVGWQEYVEGQQIRAEFLANAELPTAYASARLVLNDHHEYMAETGFLSNRLFDATATATRVISDRALGLEEVFGGVVRTYGSVDELAHIANDLGSAFPSYEERLIFAKKIAQEHSFDSRAKELVSFVVDNRVQA